MVEDATILVARGGDCTSGATVWCGICLKAKLLRLIAPSGTVLSTLR